MMLEGGRSPGPRKTQDELIPENACPIHRIVLSDGQDCPDCWTDRMAEISKVRAAGVNA